MLQSMKFYRRGSSLLGLGVGTVAMLALGGPYGSAQAAERQPRFSCQFYQGQYTVMYYPKSRPNEPFAWATPGLLGGGWTPERRCNEIARRFEEYRPDGLVELQNSQLNNYNVVCVTTKQNPACRLVFTIPPGQDPVATRNRVFQNVVSAGQGQQTQAVNTYGSEEGEGFLGSLVKLGRSVLKGDKAAESTQQNGPINLLPFLDPSDGGTGAALK